LNDKSWTESQDPELIKAITEMQSVLQNMSTQIYIFIDLFQQYVGAMYQSPIFAKPAGDEAQNGDVNPNTNFSESADSEQLK
jgi:hypothetical protein